MRSLESRITGPMIHAKALDFFKKLKDGEVSLQLVTAGKISGNQSMGSDKVSGGKLSAEYSEFNRISNKTENVYFRK